MTEVILKYDPVHEIIIQPKLSSGFLVGISDPEASAEINKALHDQLRRAATDLYFAAHWSPDRPCDAKKLWEALRDAAGIEPGQTAEKLGPVKDVHPGIVAFVRMFIAKNKISKNECGDLPLAEIAAFMDRVCEIVGYHKEPA